MAEQQVNLLFFAGSTRQGSLNKRLALAGQGAAERLGFAASFIDLADYPMPIYSGDLEAAEGPPEAARLLKAVFEQHHGIFIASPEYNASFTPLLKNTLDWVSRVRGEGEPPLQVYKTRVWALGAASGGGYGGMRGLIALRQTLALGLGALVLSDQIAVSGADKVLGEDGSLSDPRFSSLLDGVVRQLAHSAQRLAA
jgi:NAD(P)H-dependent FMN reductase